MYLRSLFKQKKCIKKKREKHCTTTKMFVCAQNDLNDQIKRTIVLYMQYTLILIFQCQKIIMEYTQKSQLPNTGKKILKKVQKRKVVKIKNKT